MIHISPDTKIFVSLQPLDFRNGFNGTAAACRKFLDQNPLDGGLFVFINRYRTIVRFYLFDGHGEWLASKRIAQGKFHWWKNSGEDISAEHLYLLMRGADPNSVTLPIMWKKIG